MEELSRLLQEETDKSSRYRLLREQASDGIAIYDLKGNVVEANSRACEMLGYTLDEVLGLNLATDIICPEDLARSPIKFEDLRTGRIIVSERLLRRKDGSVLQVEASSKLLLDGGGIQVIIRDITERKQVEEALRASEARFRAVFESAMDAILVVDDDGRYIDANPAALELIGRTHEELSDASIISLVPPDRLDEVQHFSDQLSTYGAVSSEFQIMRPEGQIRDIEFAVKRHFLPGYHLIIVRDITERKMLQEQLAHQAFHDSLTNLPNRALFMDRLPQALARSERRGDFVAVLFLDLDDFKVINDSLGHKAGDQMLIEVGRRLLSSVRAGDSVARLGGDEFTILLEDMTDISEATVVAERIAEQLRAPFHLEGHEVFVTTSIGIATSTLGHNTPEALLRNADIAMYEAKAKGKAIYKVFDQSMNSRAWERLQLEIDLRRAIESEEFKVYYQPVVRLDTGQIAEVEALVRWDHPQRNLVAPMEFIPFAEETGLILPIGHWVLDEACKQVKAWQAQYPLDPPLMLSVNLSARQFKHHNLVEDIAGALNKSGLEPRCLKLEITESAALEAVDSTSVTLHELKVLGIQLAIDDFGTGYSALSYLKRYTVDTLKLDRSFIKGLGRDPEDTAIVRAILAFAEALNLSVTAEGIETSEQCAHLRALGCHYGQGFYFSKPIPPEDVTALLAIPIEQMALVMGKSH